jgi:hypothetical protein
MKKLHGYGNKQAWLRFFRGVLWTKAEHDNAHQEILQNTSMESLDIHRKNIEAKAKRLLNLCE